MPTWLREAAWLTPARVRAYRTILAIVFATILTVWLLTQGVGPLFGDYLGYWGGARLAMEGRIADTYSLAALHAMQYAMFGESVAHQVAGFVYPPMFLFLCIPFAVLPFVPSAVAWLAVTGTALAAVLRPLMRGVRHAWLALVLFPASWLNAGFGQNGFVSAALFGAAAITLERRPILAGIAFGALTYKPQLGILVPIALLAARRWRAFCSAAVTTVALGLLSLAAFGVEAWRGFLLISEDSRVEMETGTEGFWKMASPFSAVRLTGGGMAASYALQIAAIAVTAAVVIAVTRRRPGGRAEVATTISGALLCTPYLHVYDLTLLAVPMAWLFGLGVRAGFRPWEKIALLILFWIPLAGSLAAKEAAIPLTQLTIAAFFAVVARRAGQMTPSSASFSTSDLEKPSIEVSSHSLSSP